jgi:hypothetical protein
MDSDHVDVGKLDPDPHRREKLNPDPYQHESQKQDPGPHQSQNPEAVEAQNAFYCSMVHRYQYYLLQNRTIRSRTIKLKKESVYFFSSQIMKGAVF